MSGKIKNMNDLVADAVELREKIRNEAIDLTVAKEMNNTHGKVNKSVSHMLDNAKQSEKKPNIDMLEGCTK